jgi:hypothetical protein
MATFFCYFKKLPKVNTRILGENSPNPVTLAESNLDLTCFQIVFFPVFLSFLFLPHS